MEALIARYSSPHDDFFDDDEDDTAQFTTTIPAKGGGVSWDSTHPLE
jgi:hypothetical protein